MSCTSPLSRSSAGRTPGRRVLVIRGFTLVELLVVIGIIAVLIGILMPTLSRVRAHAISTQCMSNLRSIGQAAHIYAAENKGFLPPAQVDVIESITGGALIANGPAMGTWPSHQLKQHMHRVLQGGTAVFYCPANDLWEGEANATVNVGTPPTPMSAPIHDPEWFTERPVFGSTASVRIKYWWVGNPYRPSGLIVPPDSDGFVQFHDSDNDGSRRDEYMCKVNEKHADEIVIATDQTRQVNAATGWTFFHGTRRNVGQGNTDASTLQSSWKNNLYGDGHVDRRRPDEVKLRWGAANPAAW
jgi:prepilin-type N-terminal cleavage/methylation domain-containing protein